MKYIIISLSIALVLAAYFVGINPILERAYYGPDKSDCIRIVGCSDGDAVVWVRQDVQTSWVCVDNRWFAYDDTQEALEDDSYSKDEVF